MAGAGTPEFRSGTAGGSGGPRQRRYCIGAPEQHPALPALGAVGCAALSRVMIKHLVDFDGPPHAELPVRVDRAEELVAPGSQLDMQARGLARRDLRCTDHT